MAEITASKCALREENRSDVLQRYNRCYEDLRAFCTKSHRRQGETILLWVEAIALYAAYHHPGRFADGAIENIALEIGRDLAPFSVTETSRYLPQQLPRPQTGGKRRVLHVAPGVWDIGGHTRTLTNWIRSDPDSQHSLLLIRQRTSAIPSWLSEEVRHSGGEIIVLPEKTGMLVRARMVREIAQSSTDLIVLHHTCKDITPVVAFATRDLPPVAFVNDCDQAFWLGSSIADIVVNQREAGARLSMQRRFTTCNTVLPIPLELSPSMPRYAARQTLGIASDYLMLLTVGRGFKYRPTQSHNFFRTVRKVLDKVHNAHLYVVGLSEEQAVQWQLDWQHPRVHLCGPLPDLLTYRAAADLYLESFPFGSATALLEAAHAGLPVVLPFAPSSDVLVTNHGLENIVSNLGTEEEYIDRVHFLLNNVRERELLGQVLQDHVRSHHTGEGWRRQLANLYRLVEGRKHNPKPIPIADCGISNVDVALSEWHASMDEDVDPTARYVKDVREITYSVSYRCRERGDYRRAFELLWWYFSTYGFDRGMFIAAAKLPVHRIYKWWLHPGLLQTI